jgi:hypothetical protein
MIRSGRLALVTAILAVAASLLFAPGALAAGGHTPLVSGDILGIGGAVGSVFGTIGHALLGAFSWTFKLASSFILTTIGALVKMLIPRSWATQGVQIMEWIVAVPNYAAKITGPGGGQSYGFAGVNALRALFEWIGIGLLPLTLVYGTSRAMIGERTPIALPVSRVLMLAVGLISYPYWWKQAAALVNTMTHAILSEPDVANGLHKLMLYAVDGVALGGWQLIDLGLMGATAIELLALIFLKVAIILLGALLYATGPLTIGLVATDGGAHLARAWVTAAIAFLALPIAWAALFATGAVLINDAGTAGPLIAGNSAIGSLLGGLLVAIAGLAALWLCLRAAREAASLLRLQLGGLLALRGRGGSTASAGGGMRSQSAVQSLRTFSSRVAGAAGAAGGELALAGAGGAAAMRAARGFSYAGRRGAVGTAMGGVRHAAGSAAPRAGALVGRSRAGAVAARMAKAGTASWQATSPGTPAAGRRHAQSTAAADTVRHAAGEAPLAGAGNPSGPRSVPRPPTPPSPSAGAGTRGNSPRTPPSTPRPPSAPGPGAGPGASRPGETPRSPTPPRSPNRPRRDKR